MIAGIEIKYNGETCKICNLLTCKRKLKSPMQLAYLVSHIEAFYHRNYHSRGWGPNTTAWLVQVPADLRCKSVYTGRMCSSWAAKHRNDKSQGGRIPNKNGYHNQGLCKEMTRSERKLFHCFI